MSLWLGQFHYMDKYRSMGLPGNISGVFIGVDKRSVIPSVHPEDLITVRIFGALEPFEDFRNILFRGLVSGRNRNPVFIIPYTNYHGNL